MAARGIEEAAVGDYDAVTTDRIVRHVTFDLFHWLLEAGCLNRKGLLELRGRLDETRGEFFPGPDLDLIRLEAADALAADLGVDPADLPGAELPPDSPGDLPPPRW
jgi:hypothetical protein